MMTLLLVKDWGWRDNNRTYADKMRLSRAASRLIAYDTGFLRPFSYAEIMVWESDVKLHLDQGEFAVDLYLKSKQSSSIAYVDSLEKRNSGYLHELFRYSINTIGSKASFAAIATCMNGRSCIISETRESIFLSRLQINNWFVANGGK